MDKMHLYYYYYSVNRKFIHNLITHLGLDILTSRPKTYELIKTWNVKT